MAWKPPPGASKGSTNPLMNLAQKKALKDLRSGGNFVDRAANDISNSVSNLPRGVVGIAKGAVREAKSSIQDTDWSDPLEVLKAVNPAVNQALTVANLGNKALGGKALPKFVQPSVASQRELAALGGGFNTDATKGQTARHPLLTSQGESFRNTYSRISNPGKALRDYSQHPFSSLAEDAGNISLVAAPATGALKGLGLAKTAEVVSRVGEAANAASQGPFLPVSATARVVNKGLGKVAEVAGRSERVQNFLTDIHADAGTRAVKQVLESGKEKIGAVANRQARLGKQIAHVIPKLDEQEAALLVGERLAPALSKLRQADATGFEQAVAELPGHITPAAAHLAADIVEGKNPTLSGRVDEALRVGREGKGGRLQREEFQLSQGLNPEQIGNQPLSRVVREAVIPVEQKLSKAERLADVLSQKEIASRSRLDVAKANAEFTALPQIGTKDLTLERRLGREQQRQSQLVSAADRAQTQVQKLRQSVQDTRMNVAQSVEAMPARYRAMGTINRAVQSHLTGTENALRSAGLTEQAAQIGKLAETIPTTLEAFRAEGIDPEHFIHIQFEDKPAGGINPAAIPSTKAKSRGQKQRKGTAFERTIPAQAKAELDEFTTGIKRATIGEIGKLPLSAKLNQGPLAGVISEEGALKAGYVPIEKGSEVFVPERIRKAFTGYFSPKEPQGLAKYLLGTYDAGTKAFKTLVLPLSPSWNINNMVGNAFMATVGAGVDPITLSHNILKAIKEYRASGPKGLREFQGPDRLYSSGPTFEALDFMNPKIQAKGRVGRALLAVPNLGYRANQFVDDVGRTAVYMAKKQAGHTDELALKEALRAMGDFSKMNPLERNVVRRVIPFYAWQKHITKLMFTLPIEHPYRTAWTLDLANQYGQPEDWVRGLPDYLQTLVPLGGGTATPFTSGFPFPVNPVENFSRAGILRNLSPQIKAVIENTTGINTLTGQPFSRPTGTGKLDQYGKPLPTAPSYLQQLRGISPQMRLYDNLSGYNDVARYSTGDPILKANPVTGKKEPLPSTKPKGAAAILKFLGIPLSSTQDLKATAARIDAAKVKVATTKAKASVGGSGGKWSAPPSLK